MLTGSEISIYYDPLIAKISSWAPDRLATIQKMHLALRETVALGLTTNQRFLVAVMENSRFERGDLSTGFIEEEQIHKRSRPPKGLMIMMMCWLLCLSSGYGIFANTSVLC